METSVSGFDARLPDKIYGAMVEWYNATLSRCEVAGSSPVGSAKYHNPIKSVEDEETDASAVLMILKYDSVAQLVRVPVCQAGGRRFEPGHCRKDC